LPQKTKDVQLFRQNNWTSLERLHNPFTKKQNKKQSTKSKKPKSKKTIIMESNSWNKRIMVEHFNHSTIIYDKSNAKKKEKVK